MVEIKVNGAVVPLKFDLNAMDAIEESTGRFVGEIDFAITSKDKREELMAVIAALADSAGAELTREQMRRMSPGELAASMYGVSKAISEGMRMETDAEDPDAEVDVVLEEIKKNGAPGA